MQLDRQLNPITVSISEACRLTSLGRTKIYDLIADGRLTPIKIGRRSLLRFDDLAKLLSREERSMA